MASSPPPCCGGSRRNTLRLIRSMVDLAIRGGQVVTPQGILRTGLYVKQGRIVAIGNLDLPAAETVDAGGLVVLPGVVDSHVHFMDPGATDREDFITGSAAAAVGGATTVIEHTHASPIVDEESLKEKAGYLKDRSVVDFGLGAHVLPQTIDRVREVWEAGALFLKVFTCTTHGITGLSPADLLVLFRQAREFGGICLVHAEDESLTAEAERRLRAMGRTDGGIVPEWRNREAELTAVNVVSLLARLSQARVVVAHVSHANVLDLIERERRLGTHLWAEGCPQYFYLLESEVLELGAFRKFTPPARARHAGDLAEMWHRLMAGQLTHVATDHAPATRAQKLEASIWDVHFGLPGVETTLTLMLNGVAEGWLSFERLAQALSETPAQLYGLHPRKGALVPGADADIVLVDPQREHVLSDERIISRAGWTPFAGRRVRGAVVMTFLRGRRIAEEGKVLVGPGLGRYLARLPH